MIERCLSHCSKCGLLGPAQLHRVCRVCRVKAHAWTVAAAAVGGALGWAVLL